MVEVNNESCNVFFDMLSTQSRLDIVKSLHKGERSVGEICKAVSSERTNVSHQLKLLRECGFVLVRREGKRKIYSLNSETVKPILDLAEKHARKYCRVRLCKRHRRPEVARN